MSKVVSTAQILKAIDELREDRKEDSAALWKAITKLDETVSELSTAVSTGRGAVRALAWVGGVIIAILGLVAAFINAVRPH